MLAALAIVGGVLALLGPPVEPESPATPTEEVPTEAESLEEEDPEDEGLDDEAVREVVVDASVLGDGNAIDVFTHAGGRTVVSKDEARERGATSVGEAVQRAPGVRTVEGNSGIGSQDTTLQVAVRGADPRLSGRATVLLDEIPIAPAPYGQPQLSLFPLSLFSIAEIDVVRGGATARYGPQTSGGVFNLTSNPIPKRPTVFAFMQGDSNRDYSMGAAYGATHKRFGMYLEYAPRFGRSFREHSDKLVHGGLAKFAWQFNPRIRLESISHAYYEDSDLPGGLTRAAYDEDPFQSQRPFDYFRGSRLGTALKFGWQISPRQDLDINGWYSHSYRTTYIASAPGDVRETIDEFVAKPRYYDVMGVEPRWSMRFDAQKFDFSHQLSIGARAGYEIAKMYSITEDAGGVLTTADDDGRTAAYAGYVAEKLIFLGGDLTLDAGVRLEYIQIVRRSNLERLVIRRNYWAPLPAASVWYAPVDQFALFAAYGRSFGPPQYLQLVVALDEQQLEPETSNSAEFGIKLLELGGLYGESTAWYKDFNNYIDVGDESFDAISTIYIWGIESELEWFPADIWDMYGEPSLYLGYGWTDSHLVGLTYTGNKMPWYPEHEAWAGAAYALDFGLELGVDVAYMGKQYTDYENREEETPDAAYGPIPAYTLVNLWMRMKAPLPNGWAVEFGGGVKNVGDLRYFSRTDDRNAGILTGRPRTYYLNVGFAHEFLPRQAREARRMRTAARKAQRMAHDTSLVPQI
ncbi:MAG TPA: TonB-dependent receptor [Enhygromyxa sp.]|nr:TonB-dependent receptor [Enhygromyxa sp.]